MEIKSNLLLLLFHHFFLIFFFYNILLLLDLGRHLASHTTQNLFLIVGVAIMMMMTLLYDDVFAYDGDDLNHHENSLAAELPFCLPCSGTLVMLVRTQIPP